jgi:hypothetical protein
MASFTKVFHHTSYSDISPSSSLNSHSGSTVLITGSSAGIGLATAEAFIIARASRVIILSRQESLLASALQTLETSRPVGSATQILGRTVSINDIESIQALWDDFQIDGIEVNILVLNAAKTGNSPIMEMGSSKTWEFFETNILSGLRMTEKFMQQGSAGKVKVYLRTLIHITNHNGLSRYSSTSLVLWHTLFRQVNQAPMHPRKPAPPPCFNAWRTKSLYRRCRLSIYIRAQYFQTLLEQLAIKKIQSPGTMVNTFI